MYLHHYNQEIADTFSEVQPTNSEEHSKSKGTKPQSSLLLVDKPEQPTLAIEPQQHLTAVDSQCPIYFARFPRHEIEEHADNCSLWLMESEEPAELIESGRSDVEELNGPEPDVSQHKTFKFILDTANVMLKDFIKWLTGTPTIPPLGFPKKFSIQFVHGCPVECPCRPEHVV